MEEQQKFNDSETLTIDIAATLENVRIKFFSRSAFSRKLIECGEDVSPSTVLSLFNGNMRYLARPTSEYQRLLRLFKKYGVLVELSELKEAA